MVAAGEPARLDWTDVFICTLDVGCYDSSYGYFGPYPGAKSTTEWWSVHNDCRGNTILDSIDLDWSLAGNETKLTEFNRCDARTSVRLALIERGSQSPMIDENFAAHLIDWFLNSPRRLDPNYLLRRTSTANGITRIHAALINATVTIVIKIVAVRRRIRSFLGG